MLTDNVIKISYSTPHELAGFVILAVGICVIYTVITVIHDSLRLNKLKEAQAKIEWEMSNNA